MPAKDPAGYMREWRAKHPADRKPGRPRTAEHGTRSAYNRHLADGEEPCQPCRDANARRQRDYRRAAEGPDGDPFGGFPS